MSRLFSPTQLEAAETDSDILWDRIVSIEYIGCEHVYDIEVEGTHNFVGNGIFAHNTYRQGMDGAEGAGPLRQTGYRHFFYQKKGDKDYLIWRRQDRKGVMHELKWQRGAGGRNVPSMITVDDDDNEEIILEILKSAYLQDVEYTSYTQDGRYYIRCGTDKELILMERTQDGIWQEKRIFPRIKQSLPFVEEGKNRDFQKPI